MEVRTFVRVYAPRKTSRAWIGPRDKEVYAYLLGLYLGDGCITVPRRGRPRVVLSLDLVYPEIVAFAERSLALVFPGSTVNKLLR
jgi:hypothetical protein